MHGNLNVKLPPKLQTNFLNLGGLSKNSVLNSPLLIKNKMNMEHKQNSFKSSGPIVDDTKSHHPNEISDEGLARLEKTKLELDETIKDLDSKLNRVLAK